VPHAQRLLTKDGVGNLLRGLKASSVEKKAAAAKLEALKPKVPSKSFADRLKAASGSLMNVMKKKEVKKEELNSTHPFFAFVITTTRASFKQALISLIASSSICISEWPNLSLSASY
jgi:hypothetical protein